MAARADPSELRCVQQKWDTHIRSREHPMPGDNACMPGAQRSEGTAAVCRTAAGPTPLGDATNTVKPGAVASGKVSSGIATLAAKLALVPGLPGALTTRPAAGCSLTDKMKTSLAQSNSEALSHPGRARSKPVGRALPSRRRGDSVASDCGPGLRANVDGRSVSPQRDDTTEERVRERQSEPQVDQLDRVHPHMPVNPPQQTQTPLKGRATIARERMEEMRKKVETPVRTTMPGAPYTDNKSGQDASEAEPDVTAPTDPLGKDAQTESKAMLPTTDEVEPQLETSVRFSMGSYNSQKSVRFSTSPASQTTTTPTPTPTRTERANRRKTFAMLTPTVAGMFRTQSTMRESTGSIAEGPCDSEKGTGNGSNKLVQKDGPTTIAAAAAEAEEKAAAIISKAEAEAAQRKAEAEAVLAEAESARLAAQVEKARIEAEAAELKEKQEKQELQAEQHALDIGSDPPTRTDITVCVQADEEQLHEGDEEATAEIAEQLTVSEQDCSRLPPMQVPAIQSPHGSALPLRSPARWQLRMSCLGTEDTLASESVLAASPLPITSESNAIAASPIPTESDTKTTSTQEANKSSTIIVDKESASTAAAAVPIEIRKSAVENRKPSRIPRHAWLYQYEHKHQRLVRHCSGGWLGVPDTRRQTVCVVEKKGGNVKSDGSCSDSHNQFTASSDSLNTKSTESALLDDEDAEFHAFVQRAQRTSTEVAGRDTCSSPTPILKSESEGEQLQTRPVLRFEPLKKDDADAMLAAADAAAEQTALGGDSDSATDERRKTLGLGLKQTSNQMEALKARMRAVTQAAAAATTTYSSNDDHLTPPAKFSGAGA